MDKNISYNYHNKCFGKYILLSGSMMAQQNHNIIEASNLVITVIEILICNDLLNSLTKIDVMRNYIIINFS